MPSTFTEAFTNIMARNFAYVLELLIEAPVDQKSVEVDIEDIPGSMRSYVIVSLSIPGLKLVVDTKSDAISLREADDPTSLVNETLVLRMLSMLKTCAKARQHFGLTNGRGIVP